MQSRSLSLFVLALTGIGFVSCSGSSGTAKKVCYPVRGQLFVKAQPAAGALVILHPQQGGPPEEWTAGYPRAQVAADGTFSMETYGDQDGAPAGEYTVLVSWSQGAGGEETEDTQMVDRLGGRYSDAAKSQLHAKVDNGPTELPPLRLP